MNFAGFWHSALFGVVMWPNQDATNQLRSLSMNQLFNEDCDYLQNETADGE